MLDFQAARWTIGHEIPGQAGNDHPTSIPTGVFATADGHINIAASGTEIFTRLCKALGAPRDGRTNPAYDTDDKRSANRKALNAEIEAITRTKTSAAWIELLNSAGVPSGPINNMKEVFADPQVRHLNIARRVHHNVLGDVEVIGQAVELSRTKWEIRSATPEQGEHTDAILGELGYDAAVISRLRAGKVV